MGNYTMAGEKKLEAQNIVYASPAVYQATLEHVLAIFGNFEIFCIF